MKARLALRLDQVSDGGLKVIQTVDVRGTLRVVEPGETLVDSLRGVGEAAQSIASPSPFD
jgi:hypothetical protein